MTGSNTTTQIIIRSWMQNNPIMSQIMNDPEDRYSTQQCVGRLLSKVDNHITSLQSYQESIRAIERPQLQQQVWRVVELLKDQITSQRFIRLHIRDLQVHSEEPGSLQCLGLIVEELKTSQDTLAQWTLQDLKRQQDFQYFLDQPWGTFWWDGSQAIQATRAQVNPFGVQTYQFQKDSYSDRKSIV